MKGRRLEARERECHRDSAICRYINDVDEQLTASVLTATTRLLSCPGYILCRRKRLDSPMTTLFRSWVLVRRGLQGCVRQSQKRTWRSYFSYCREPSHMLDRQVPRLSAEEAVSVVKSGDTVFVHGAAATPQHLLEALADHGKKKQLKDVQVCHIHTEHDAPYTHPDLNGVFRSNSFFMGANVRKAVEEGRSDSLPIFLSEIPLLFTRKIINVDVALIQVTPPDRHGFCSLGPSVDCVKAALQSAKHIVAQVNPLFPRTFGDSIIHHSHFDSIVEHKTPMYNHIPKQLCDAEMQIGKIIAENLVEDGATLQMGIGTIPDAVLNFLGNHKDLGIHSEMFSDGVVSLVHKGCITNHHKKLYPGKILVSFVVGSQKVYDFLDDNPLVEMKVVDYVNYPPNIAQNPKVTAINSCIEVDLTGQVVADSIGTRMFSGVGGQVDFIRGASIGHDGKGKPIIALSSVTNKGATKIVPTIKQGAGVVTSRAHVHYVVTEHGSAYLFGKNLRQRAHALIQIAHPDHRESLEKAAFERLSVMPSP